MKKHFWPRESALEIFIAIIHEMFYLSLIIKLKNEVFGFGAFDAIRKLLKNDTLHLGDLLRQLVAFRATSLENFFKRSHPSVHCRDVLAKLKFILKRLCLTVDDLKISSP